MKCGSIKLFVIILSTAWSAGAWSASLDLTNAVIVPESSKGPLLQAARMLSEELAERSGVSIPVLGEAEAGRPRILLGTVDALPDSSVPEKAEAYTVSLDGDAVRLVGRDNRGALFAAGRLIRLAECRPGKITLDLDSPIATAPDVPYRAHQLAYRNTANTYDAWTVDTYEQYIRDLILFGCNGVELIPSLDPEEKDGLVMTESMHSMNVKLSGLIGSYGIDVWLWSAVMAEPGEDVTNAEGKEEALEKRRKIFSDYPVIDHFFVPGGDDGDTPAEHLMPFLGSLSPMLRETHPNAKIWVSNQTFTIEENNYFFDFLHREKPDWLAGIVYGPWTKMGLEEMRDRAPRKYPIRLYPDINHTVRCQYPVRNWDPAFANTLGREPVMPMPEAHTHIYLRYRDLSDGFGTYSDGVHDDFNKILWSELGWDPGADVGELLEEYGKTWWGPDLAKSVAEGLKGLEENWRGPIEANVGIPKTLEIWEEIAERTSDFENHWRAQMYLQRARYDAYVQKKAEAEKGFEEEALAALAEAPTIGVEQAVAKARTALAKADGPIAPELRKGIEDLGPMMLKSIGYQLSVKEPYKARNPERGAVLDWLDQPLNDQPWLEQRFEAILGLEDREQQLAALNEIVHWKDPGPGGFYDDLGAPGGDRHVVYQQTWEEDPSACHSPRVEFPNYKADPETIREARGSTDEANASFKEERTRNAPPTSGRQELRMSWVSQMVSNYGTPFKMRYEGLDPNASYRLKATYAGRYRPTMTLTVNETYSIHGPVAQPDPLWPVEYYLPREATRGGVLELEWDLVEGRGCSMAEVWLIMEARAED